MAWKYLCFKKHASNMPYPKHFAMLINEAMIEIPHIMNTVNRRGSKIEPCSNPLTITNKSLSLLAIVVNLLKGRSTETISINLFYA